MLLLGLHTLKKISLANLVCFNKALEFTGVKAEYECTAQQRRLNRNLTGPAPCMDTLARRRHVLLCFWLLG